MNLQASHLVFTRSPKYCLWRVKILNLATVQVQYGRQIEKHLTKCSVEQQKCSYKIFIVLPHATLPFSH